MQFKNFISLAQSVYMPFMNRGSQRARQPPAVAAKFDNFGGSLAAK